MTVNFYFLQTAQTASKLYLDFLGSFARASLSMHLLTCLLFLTVFDHTVSLKRIPVIIDTDIGYSTDDLSAIAVALQRPELEIKLIVTATGDTKELEERARIVAKFLHIIGREDVPIGIGVSTSKKAKVNLAEWADDFDLKDYKGHVYQDGVKAMADIIELSSEHIDIIAIAPANNIYSLLQRFPDAKSKANVKAMCGSIYRGYHNSSEPVAEYNVEFCPECTRAMFNAPWKVTITPVDTCGVVSLRGQSYSTLLKSSGITALAFAQVTLFWAFKNLVDVSKETEILFDSVAPYMVIPTKHSLLEYEELQILITDEGKMVISPDEGAPVNVALYWKKKGLSQFELWIAESLNKVLKPKDISKKK